MKPRTMLWLAAAMIVATGAADAHHSFAGTYHEEDSMTIEGELVQFLYRNPHSFVHVLVPADNGETERWAIEWGGVAQLNREGVDRFTLKPGETVRITGAPSRSVETDRRLLMRGIERLADGWAWGGQVD